MKKLIFILCLICLAQSGNSQVSNMYLLRNLDLHSGTNSACWGYIANGREYAIMGCQTGIAFFDITDSSNIHEVAFKTAPNSIWHEMKVYSHYAYCVSEASNSGLQIFDLAYLPDSVHLVTTFFMTGFTRTHAISQSGSYLYMNGGDYMTGGVFVLDITNPEVPVKRGQWETEYVHDCRVRNDTIWACNINTGHISIINAANKDNLTIINQFTNNAPPYAPHNCELSGNSRYLFVTDETNSGKIKVWDVQNLANVVQVAVWAVPSTTETVHNIEIYGTQAVVAYYSKGIRVLDISSPANPVEIGYYTTPGCWGVYKFPSGKIIGSDMNNGLYVLKVGVPFGIKQISTEVPSDFSLFQNYPNPFNPETNFKFQITNYGFVDISLYNSSGKIISTLVNENLNPGAYLVNWDASNYPSGVYYYRLSTSNFSETKKMILLK